ncbi:uncharacterized protein LOC143018876 [Oratosquilla oratoria]|uniref:uncharacterized protein LOC143018876 n=1 Tax=Oratosquilla oratoria TaxID=337810 RepID=UPI003F770FD0
MSKSTPSTPTAAKRRNFSQTGNPDGAETGSSGGSGWFGALGGVVGDWLNGWGLLGALRRRSGVGSGMRSMPATPPTNSHPSSPAHEHIELNNLNMEWPPRNTILFSSTRLLAHVGCVVVHTFCSRSLLALHDSDANANMQIAKSTHIPIE